MEPWFFRVDYIEVNNRTDAEFLESHFIAYYKTFKYFNIAKKNWGESDVYPKGKYKWKVYIIYDNDLTLKNIEHKKCDPKLFEKNQKFGNLQIIIGIRLYQMHLREGVL